MPAARRSRPTSPCSSRSSSRQSRGRACRPSTALAAAERQPLTILGDLVHNETVLANLRARGIRTCTEIGDINTATVMISTHGASGGRLAQLRARGLRVLDVTCPLVRAAHRAVAAQ